MIWLCGSSSLPKWKYYRKWEYFCNEINAMIYLCLLLRASIVGLLFQPQVQKFLSLLICRFVLRAFVCAWVTLFAFLARAYLRVWLGCVISPANISFQEIETRFTSYTRFPVFHLTLYSQERIKSESEILLYSKRLSSLISLPHRRS